MAKERWLINPAELDEFQREILGLSITDSYVVKGCAGSGKTILALHRVNDIRIQSEAEGVDAPSFIMVVYTKALRSFIRSGVQELGINLKQVVIYDKWDGSAVDHLVVDEAQDFQKSKVDEFAAASRTSMMFYGDSHQQVYQGRMSIEEIAKHLGLKEMELLKNYRLPKQIASFASHLCNDKDLEKKCVKNGISKPRVHEFRSWQAELDFIVSEIGTRNYTDVAILLPFNERKDARTNNIHRNIEEVKEYFDKLGFRYQYKMRTDDGDSMDLDFESDLPKVMTFHSAKGLQFETVFIPFCDYPNHDDWFHSKYSNPFYVGVTRSYLNLYITHSESLSLFLKGVPGHKVVKSSYKK